MARTECRSLQHLFVYLPEVVAVQAWGSGAVRLGPSLARGNRLRSCGRQANQAGAAILASLAGFPPAEVVAASGRALMVA